MKITLEMLFGKFHSRYPDASEITCPADISAPISGIGLLPPDPEKCESGHLYLCLPSFPTLSETRPKDFDILCVSPESFVPDNPRVFVLCSPLDITEVFNALLSIYFYFSDWEKNLDFAIYRNASAQEIVDLSEDILENPLMILDPALKVVVSTKNHTAEDDAAFSFAISKGYLSPESVRLFEEDHTFERVYTDRFLSSNANRARAYSDMIQGIKLNDGSTVYIVLLHTSAAGKSYVKQIFQIFTQTIETVFQNQKDDFLRERYVEDYFLIDLLENRDLSPEIIRERLQYINLPFRDYFLFCTIYSDLRQTSSEQYFINILRNALPDYHVFSYDGAIAVFLLMPQSASENYKSYIARKFRPVEKNLRSHNAKICISRPFYSIDQIYTARQQTKNCYRLSQKSPSSKIYEFYDNYVLQNLFAGHTSVDLLYDFCDPVLLEIYRSGDEKDIYQMRILESYLKHDRKSSAAAEDLNMHRNNVNYHIRQISETRPWNLNNPNVRFRLLLSFALLKYQNQLK